MLVTIVRWASKPAKGWFLGHRGNKAKDRSKKKNPNKNFVPEKMQLYLTYKSQSNINFEERRIRFKRVRFLKMSPQIQSNAISIFAFESEPKRR